MVKLTLTYVNRTPKTSKENKPYVSLSLKAKEYGDKYLSGFGNKANENWKEGMEVEVLEIKEVQKNDKTYLNFEMPKVAGQHNEEFARLLREMNQNFFHIKLMVEEIHEATVPKAKVKIPGTDMDYPVNEGKEITFESNEELDEDGFVKTKS